MSMWLQRSIWFQRSKFKSIAAAVAFIICFGLFQNAEARDLLYTYYNISSSPENASPRPLIVLIHGCNQDFNEFIETTNILEKTQHLNPLILAPHQTGTFNPLKCWNFLSKNMLSRSGDFMQITAEVRRLIEVGLVDSKRIYVGGFSSGAILANSLALCFPDIFKGGLIHSGAPFNVKKGLSRNAIRKSINDAIQCGSQAENPQLKTLVYLSGDKDRVLPPILGRNAFEQTVHIMDHFDDKNFNDSAREVLRNKDGGISVNYENQSVHYYEIEGLKHHWSGSKPGTRYSSPSTINAIDLFLKHTNNLE